MTDTAHFLGNSAYQVISAIEAFDGSCDPDFDIDLGELERQFAELRIAMASE